jgi:hypothetical protein
MQRQRSKGAHAARPARTHTDPTIAISAKACGRHPRLSLIRIWRQALHGMVMVKPATVLQCHRRGFRLYWRRRPKRASGLQRKSPAEAGLRTSLRGHATVNTDRGALAHFALRDDQIASDKSAP